MSRTYNFPLPFTIPGWKLSMGLNHYKADPNYQRLPHNLREALEQGEAEGRPVQVQKKDLDRLPDDLWDYIRATLQLP